MVKLLLERGYRVRGVVRSPDNNEKCGHVERLEGAKEGLTLLKGDLLDPDSLSAAIDGCSGVFHMACPVPSYTLTNPEVEVLSHAIKGTLNVLEACKNSKVKRIVMTSSVAAMAFDLHKPKDAPLDESCWSDEDYLRENNHWCMLGKTMGEKAAWDYSQKNGLDLVVICPSLVLGSLLQASPNTSSLVVLKLLNGSSDSYENSSVGVVDVKDVANAHLLAYETKSASGRYLCRNKTVTRAEMIEIIRRLHPDYTLPTRMIEPQISLSMAKEFSQKKIIVNELGPKYTPVETTIKETVESLKEKGLF
ncbi:hypothetical protein KP509_30G017800 [Ceratopteris richardii]|uniref:NAD-dependent epimerase/dehydratase domain-containing protein n=1 Tax=Ceratopteris richardii TaxID=49495 RepID=A0A8T2R1E8_CERRI|nr:hypothetical protein KP509_30G017800 [Ceratopteris richardii]